MSAPKPSEPLGVQMSKFGPSIPVPQILIVKMLEMLGGSVVFDSFDIKLEDVGGALRLEELKSIEFFEVREPFQLVIRIAE